jgi:hypothetical protein
VLKILACTIRKKVLLSTVASSPAASGRIVCIHLLNATRSRRSGLNPQQGGIPVRFSHLLAFDREGSEEKS